MPKLKPHKGLLKRVKITATGKVKHRRAGTGHLLSVKSGDKLRELRSASLASAGDVKHIERMLHRKLRGPKD